jgi:hypothetical protein
MLKPTQYPAVLLAILFLLVVSLSSFNDLITENNLSHNDTTASKNNIEKEALISIDKINYSLWNLQTTGLSKEAFDYAIKGYNYLTQKGLLVKKNIITIVDFSKPSTEKRLYVLDILNGKILFNTLVAHGHNSGDEYATRFSNSNRSHQSSLGFYITLGTYIGDNGYSLQLKGCEKGFNDNAYKRKIVLHGSDYVSENFINANGYLGRSFGCPAVPLGLHKEIIDCIKDGSCLFLYHPTKRYLIRSKILNS